MIVVTYTPATPPKPGAPIIGLVGKAVTFDTGGISIKPADGMEKMKYDMAGGATVRSDARASRPKAQRQSNLRSPQHRKHARRQSPKARRHPDRDVRQDHRSANADAEGRLILADGVHYAKQLGATHLVDAATLTGAIVVALANINVGVFGGSDGYPRRTNFSASAKAVGEKMWQMPMDDEYREFIKGSFADIQNLSSGKGGGSITGAWFIREFAGDTPWIHLDIAGTAWNDDAKPSYSKGPTGVALRTLVNLVMSSGTASPL